MTFNYLWNAHIALFSSTVFTPFSLDFRREFFRIKMNYFLPHSRRFFLSFSTTLFSFCLFFFCSVFCSASGHFFHSFWPFLYPNSVYNSFNFFQPNNQPNVQFSHILSTVNRQKKNRQQHTLKWLRSNQVSISAFLSSHHFFSLRFGRFFSFS